MTKEILGLKTVPRVFCKTDKSLEEHLKSSKVIQDLRLRVDIIARLSEMVKLGKIEVHWVDKTHQLADLLTRYGASVVCLLNVFKCGKL